MIKYRIRIMAETICDNHRESHGLTKAGGQGWNCMDHCPMEIIATCPIAMSGVRRSHEYVNFREYPLRGIPHKNPNKGTQLDKGE